MEIPQQYLDELYYWVAENKFDEFSTIKDNYESDLEQYIEENSDDLWTEFSKQLIDQQE